MSTLWQQALNGQPLNHLEIIDMHGHLGACEFAIPECSPAALVAVMDRLGVRSIVCSHMQCMGSDYAWGNREIRQAAETFPGRILGYALAWPDDPRAAQAEVEACFRHQCFVGMKMYDEIGFPYTDPAYALALGVVNERAMPVLLHTWGHPHQFAQVRELARLYPRAAFLLAHAGAAREDEYIRLAREYENVYLDLTKSLCSPGQVERLVAGAGLDKVLFGSDAMFINLAHQIGRVLGARLSDEDKATILSRNAKKLLARIER